MRDIDLLVEKYLSEKMDLGKGKEMEAYNKILKSIMSVKNKEQRKSVENLIDNWAEMFRSDKEPKSKMVIQNKREKLKSMLDDHIKKLK